MIHRLRQPLFAFMVLGSSPAFAQVADLSRASCSQVLELPQNDRNQLLLWLNGYYAGAAQRSSLDRTKIEDSAAAAMKFCETHPNMPLIGAEARGIFLGEPLPQQPAASQTPPNAAARSMTGRPSPVPGGVSQGRP